MICVSFAGIDFEECRTLLHEKEIAMAEIRLDKLDLTAEEITKLFGMHKSLIATHRPGNISEKDRKKSLIAAINAGAAYVDLELETPLTFKKAIIKACRKKECKVIISYHNFENTPPKDELESIVDQCVKEGADIAKIACRVNLGSDSARLLSLYDRACVENKRLVAVGMGEKGKITRAAIPLLGAPFTYASLEAGMETAPGQLDKLMLEKIFKLM